MESNERSDMPAFTPRQPVTHNGRPAVVITAPEVGATGTTLYGIRYTDGPTHEPLPGYPGMMRPIKGTAKIVAEADIVAA